MEHLILTSQLFNRLVLKSEVILPILSADNILERVVHKVSSISDIQTLNPQTPTKKLTYLKEKLSQQSIEADPQLQKKLELQKRLEAGELALRKNQVQIALSKFNDVLKQMNKMKSPDYYLVLNKKAECLKKMKRVNQTFAVYSQLSLTFAGN